jgi:hypothetical protein
MEVITLVMVDWITISRTFSSREVMAMRTIMEGESPPSLYRMTGHILILSSTSLAAHAAPPGLSYPPPPAAAAYPPPMPHSRSNPNMADHRQLNPHTQVQRDYFQPQRTRTPDIYDVPGAMPYDEPDSRPYGYSQHQHQHQQGGYHRQDSFNSTSNAGHWNRRV